MKKFEIPIKGRDTVLAKAETLEEAVQIVLDNDYEVAVNGKNAKEIANNIRNMFGEMYYLC